MDYPEFSINVANLDPKLKGTATLRFNGVHEDKDSSGVTLYPIAAFYANDVGMSSPVTVNGIDYRVSGSVFCVGGTWQAYFRGSHPYITRNDNSFGPVTDKAQQAIRRLIEAAATAYGSPDVLRRARIAQLAEEHNRCTEKQADLEEQIATLEARKGAIEQEIGLGY